MVKRLLIIPAREGSKRIPLKNIKLFCGEPIIKYVINNAKRLIYFQKYMSQLESYKEIKKNKSEKLGLSIDFMRPASLSGAKTPVIDVLKYVYEKYKNKLFL